MPPPSPTTTIPAQPPPPRTAASSLGPTLQTLWAREKEAWAHTIRPALEHAASTLSTVDRVVLGQHNAARYAAGALFTGLFIAAVRR